MPYSGKTIFMMFRFIVLTISFCGIAFSAPSVFAGEKNKRPTPSGRSMSIVAVVNQDALSESDVQDRLHLVIASSGLPDSPDLRKRVLPQVLDGLIEEQLKLQEGQRLNIEVKSEDITQGLKAIADQNKFSLEQFEAIMKSQGISRSTMERQISAQSVWSKVVQGKIRPQITVSPNDVDARKARIQGAVGKTEYLVSEIFLPVETPAADTSVRQLAEKISSELTMSKNSAPFAAVAAQFSKSPGAAEKGGSMGWVQDGQLPKELNDVLPSLSEGQISPVIRGANGYHILQMSKKRIISPELVPSDDDILNQIGLERLTRAQARYLADLKAAAFIDRKF
jgi:peptidyl-prolyl cis-trans isomerase SurA